MAEGRNDSLHELTTPSIWWRSLATWSWIWSTSMRSDTDSTVAFVRSPTFLSPTGTSLMRSRNSLNSSVSCSIISWAASVVVVTAAEPRSRTFACTVPVASATESVAAVPYRATLEVAVSATFFTLDEAAVP